MPRRKQMLLLTGAICAVCMAVLIVVLIQGPRQEIRFTPPFEENAVTGMPPVTEADGYRPIDAQVFRFSICGELILEDSSTDVWLTNHAENTVWLKARLSDADDNELGETGLLRPGEYVQRLHLTKVSETTEEVVLMIMSYEPDTYYSMGSVTLYTTLTIPKS